jgi:hypothetical protein
MRTETPEHKGVTAWQYTIAYWNVENEFSDSVPAALVGYQKRVFMPTEGWLPLTTLFPRPQQGKMFAGLSFYFDPINWDGVAMNRKNWLFPEMHRTMDFDNEGELDQLLATVQAQIPEERLTFDRTTNTLTRMIQEKGAWTTLKYQKILNGDGTYFFELNN